MIESVEEEEAETGVPRMAEEHGGGDDVGENKLDRSSRLEPADVKALELTRTSAAQMKGGSSRNILEALLMLGFDESKARKAAERCSSIEAAVEYATAAFGGRAMQNSGRRFNCPVCLDNVCFDDSVTLDCDHTLCSGCFVDYCQSKIREGRVLETELVCPVTGHASNAMKICGQAISVEQVRGTVEQALFHKFLDFRAQNWKLGESDGMLVHCPMPDCCHFVAEHGLEKAKCPKCGIDLCLHCYQQVHPDETCQQSAARRQMESPLANLDNQFEELVSAQGWQRCPKCNSPTELESGCYFMQCHSAKMPRASALLLFVRTRVGRRGSSLWGKPCAFPERTI